MVAVAIFSWLIVGATYLYQNFISTSISQRKEAERNTNIGIGLTIIDRDIKMAGFGSPDASQVASGIGTWSVLGGTFTDRLFLADGWEVMRDFTNNKQDDGEISDDLYGTISKTREGGSGSCTALTAFASTGTLQIYVDNLDIEHGAGLHADIDFREGTSIIIQSGNIPGGGYRVLDVATPTSKINLSEPLRNDYPAGSIVVPAICYYIEQFEGENWLYRNSSRVIPDVENLQVMYRYNNMWYDFLPSPYDPKLLMIIRINLLVSSETRKGIRKLGTYTATVEFRN